MTSKAELGALWEIVKVLADGEFHSGEELGEMLGVSRAAVWKHLQKLEDYGIVLSSIKGKGYRIAGGLELLEREKIYSGLTAEHLLDIQIYPQLDSTNSHLLRENMPVKTVCFAEFQSAGRGRRGRLWVSPLAQNLYCSISWGFDNGAAALEGLSLAIGVAIIRSLRNSGLSGATLKWPNDVLFQEKKLAGILIEMTGDPAGYCQVVVGIGINVSMQPQGGAPIDQPWITLNSALSSEAQPYVSRNALAGALLNEVVGVLSTYQNLGFSAYQAEWMEAASYRNAQVVLRNGKSSVSGIFLGVTEAGALRIATESGEQIFHGGEVSLRLRNDS